MMRLQLRRDDPGPDCQFGVLYVDGKRFCETLEDVCREVAGADVSAWKIHGRTAIPRGSYRVEITWSPRFKRRLPLLVDVPGFAGIRIHPGNGAADTEGCILVGAVRGGNFVGNSRVAFEQLFAVLDAADAIEIEVI